MPKVVEVIRKIEEAGLEVRPNPSTHSHTLWDIVEPSTGRILTGISGHADRRGGDRNWHFNIRRILRKAGYTIEFGRAHKTKKTGEDMKKADIIDATETIERLRAFLDLWGPELNRRWRDRKLTEKGTLQGVRKDSGARPEFMARAFDVAQERNLKAWKSEGSASQTLHALLEKGQTNASIWSVKLLNATMDDIEQGPLTAPAAKLPDATPPQPDPNEDPETRYPAQPDETTYEIAISMIEEYEESFRRIAKTAGADRTDPDLWQGISDKSLTAEIAVKSMRADSDGLNGQLAEANLELADVRERLQLATAGSNGITDSYATVLLDLLKNFEADKHGNAMLDMIFARLDKLAGIS